MDNRRQNKYLILLIIGIVLFSILFLYAIKTLSIGGDTLPKDLFIKTIYYSIPYLIVITIIDYKLILYLNKIPDLEKKLLVRTIVESVTLSLIVGFIIIVANYTPYKEDRFIEYLYSGVYTKSLIAAWVLNLFTIAVLEIFIQNNRAQQMQQDYVKMQYRQLKGQINPHFLFNSLNVLVSLVNKDSQRAIDYIKKLSEVYRYVLSHDQEDMVQVADEIRFIENYLEILQIRFGLGLQTDIELSKDDLIRFIPPMSLQVLVENVVKHNSISRSNPLKIIIRSDGEYVIIENNIIPRIHVVNSMGIGLANIQEKYRIIANKDIDVVDTDPTRFIVKLPLL